MKRISLKDRKTAAIAATVFAVLLGSISFSAFSDESVSVSAIVGTLARPPIVRSVTPSLPVTTVLRNSSQSFSIIVDDADSA